MPDQQAADTRTNGSMPPEQGMQYMAVHSAPEPSPDAEAHSLWIVVRGTFASSLQGAWQTARQWLY